ncbi:MFS transporter [Bacteroidetes/Chlorobi group bacterium ChocPot_Mid]|nr:MAG: MFS transporter [Bacteroidetes/Chlorobi group bacterium ChocPot_Mid]
MQENRRERIGWYFYDWANSAFYTTVVTVFLGPYLKDITYAAADSAGFVYPLGIPIYYKSFFFYILALSFVLQFFILPILGAVADYTNKKKFLLGLFAYLGSFSTILMYFLQGSNYLFGGVLLLTANVCFGASVVMYNAYLGEIAPPDKRDAVSSIGWAIGYLGGGIVLAANALLFSYYEVFDISAGDAVRISISSTGLWWAIFTIIPMLTLKVRKPIINIPNGESVLTVGFNQLKETLKDSVNYPKTLMFLFAYLCYNEGVQVVIVSASQFGDDELGLSLGTLTMVFVIVQFVAFFGALTFNQIAKKINAKNTIMISLVIWTLSVLYAFLFLYDEFGYYLLAIVIALVLGGTQALSRSLYSNLIPIGKEAEYFSLYEVSDRGTSLIGPLVFGLALQFTGSFRIALLSICVFFVIGFLLLIRVKIPKNYNTNEMNGDKRSFNA